MQLRYSILLGNVMPLLLGCDLVECVFMLVLVFLPSGAVHFMASNNDSGVRDYDMERFQLCKHFQFDWPVNVSSFVYFYYFSCLVNLEHNFFYLLLHMVMILCSQYAYFWHLAVVEPSKIRIGVFCVKSKTGVCELMVPWFKEKKKNCCHN